MSTEIKEGYCAREECRPYRIKPLGDHDMCYGCERKHGKDKKSLEKPAKKSIKQAALDRVYAVEAAKHKAVNPFCQARLIGCTGKTEHTHHTFSGCNKQSHYTDKATFIAVCSSCHDKIHNVMSAAEAKKLNLKKS